MATPEHHHYSGASCPERGSICRSEGCRWATEAGLLPLHADCDDAAEWTATTMDADDEQALAVGAAVLGLIVGVLIAAAGASGSWYAIVPAVLANALICAAAATPPRRNRHDQPPLRRRNQRRRGEVDQGPPPTG